MHAVNSNPSEFVEYKERRVNYNGLSEFTITSMTARNDADYDVNIGCGNVSGREWLVLGCSNGDVWEVQLRTGQMRNITYGHGTRLNAAVRIDAPITEQGATANIFSSTRSGCFASCSDKGHLRIWDARLRRQVAHRLLDESPKILAASPDGLTIAAGFADNQSVSRMAECYSHCGKSVKFNFFVHLCFSISW